MKPKIWTAIVALAAYWLLVVGMQRWQGAPQAAFGAYPDEPSHYISGLMVRDYLTSGFARTPIAFAQDYYLHVPYFAIGYWPPLFYGIEAVWMLLFGPARGVTLALVALIAALIATLIFRTLQPWLGSWASFGFGALFLLVPMVEANSMIVMTDLPVALFSLAAILGLAAYLQEGRAAPLVAFTLFTSLTILTKSSGLYLSVLLPAALLLSGRWRWMLRRTFWLAPLGVALLCGPWYVISKRFLDRGLFARTDLLTAVRVLGWDTAKALGLITPLVILGVWMCLRVRPLSSLALVCMIQPLFLALFLMAAPVFVEPRYMIPALPALILLAGMALHVFAKPAKNSAILTSVVTAALVTAVGVRLFFAPHPAPENRVRPIADFVVSHNYRAVMVSADAEGPTIAEIVQGERHANDSFLIRPGKLLARMDWLGKTYEGLYSTPDQMQALFDRMPVDLVIVRPEPGPSALPHERVLADLVHSSPARWRRVYPSGPETAAYEAYEPVRETKLDAAGLENFLKIELAGPGVPAGRKMP